MKTIMAIKDGKEFKSGEIRRVDDKTAFNMVGLSWKYISKSEWKNSTRNQVGTKSEPSRQQVTGEVAGDVAGEVTGEVKQVVRVLASGSKSRAELQSALGLTGQANFRDRYLQPALEGDWFEMTIPDKPKSRSQKYRLTPQGEALLSELAEGQG